MRLRNAYVIRCDEAIKDTSGEVIELHCTYDPDTLVNNPEGRKVRGVIHWVSARLVHTGRGPAVRPPVHPPEPRQGRGGRGLHRLHQPRVPAHPDALLPRTEPGRGRGRAAVPVRARGLLLRRPRSQPRAADLQPHRDPARHLGQAEKAKQLINDAISVDPLASILTVGGQSRKVRAFAFGAIAQLGERLHGMQEVGGSIPPSSTNRQAQACRSRVNRNWAAWAVTRSIWGSCSSRWV